MGQQSEASTKACTADWASAIDISKGTHGIPDAMLGALMGRKCLERRKGGLRGVAHQTYVRAVSIGTPSVTRSVQDRVHEGAALDDSLPLVGPSAAMLRLQELYSHCQPNAFLNWMLWTRSPDARPTDRATRI